MMGNKKETFVSIDLNILDKDALNKLFRLSNKT